MCTSPTPCSRFGSIGSIAYEASLRQGVCLTISVTRSDRIAYAIFWKRIRTFKKCIHMIHFVGSIDEIPDYSNSRVVLVDDSLKSEQAVIDRIEKALDASYDKDNWDGLWDAIRDLSWLNSRSIVIVHKSLPALNGWDMKIYLEMLYDASSEWDSEVGDKEFHVFFLLDGKARVDFFLPGKFPHPQVKSKSAPATHIGDIFEIALPYGRKRYMQFILVDSSQLGAWSVRVFKTDYEVGDKPSIEEIVNDHVDFYMNTRDLGRGVLYGLWARYGQSDNLGDLNKVVFRTYHDSFGSITHRWWVWKAAQPVSQFSILPKKFLNVAEGSMHAPLDVISRIMTGRWYRFKNLYDDYGDASLIEKIHIRGIGKISDDYIVPRRPGHGIQGVLN